MKKLLMFALCATLNGCAQTSSVPSSEWQIKTAVMAAPEEYRDGAMVYGYDKDGTFVTLREGTNAYICVADDPSKVGFSTAAYQKGLDSFMARGRELKAEGKESKEIFDIRESEVKAGTLKMPDKATLCVFTGDLNPVTQDIDNPYVRYVFYVPFATGESTGLPTTATPPGHAWLMDAGTHRAHIMITPPKTEAKAASN